VEVTAYVGDAVRDRFAQDGEMVEQVPRALVGRDGLAWIIHEPAAGG